MTTTPPYPDEPEDSPDDAQQRLDGLHGEPRQDESGQTAYAAVPPPLGSPPEPPQPGSPPGEDYGQPPYGSMSGPADWQSFSQPAERTFGQTGGRQINQPDAQQYGQPYGQPSEQPFTPQYGQPGAQHFTQPPGRQQFGGQGAGAGSPYGYPAAPALPGAQQTGYGPAGTVLYAGWWKRVGAFMLDNVLVGLALDLIVEESHSSVLEGISSAIAVVWSLYNAFLAGKTGQSYGKRAVGIKLARMEDGLPVGGGYGLLRWLMNAVFGLLCVLPGVLNYLWPLWDAKHQTWSDKIADSVVVRA